MRLETLAHVAHEATRPLHAEGERGSQRWHDRANEGKHLPGWQKDDAFEKVKYQVEHPGCSAEDVHENFCALREKHGFKLGDGFSVEKKTHPGLVAWSDLPPASKQRHEVAHSVVESLRGEL